MTAFKTSKAKIKFILTCRPKYYKQISVHTTCIVKMYDKNESV